VLPASDPLAMTAVTLSMRATAKYFWVVIALFLTQILLGAMTAHYQVEGQELRLRGLPHLQTRSGMALFTLLPLGILQLIAAIDHGYWYARSADFMQRSSTCWYGCGCPVT